jgi:X-Pro dipeptidyl-peptidase
VRLSGTPRISVRADLTGKSPYLTALLVDYGTAERFDGYRGLPGEDCIGPGTPVEPGKPYSFAWDLQSDDHVFAAGHRIGVVLISTDREPTLRYPAGTEVGVRLGVSKVVLPLAR